MPDAPPPPASDAAAGLPMPARPLGAVPERIFLPPRDSGLTGVPLPSGPAKRAKRDQWLRVALFCTLLGAALTIMYAWVQARQDGGASGFAVVWVPLLAIAAAAGALLLERAPTLGMLLLLAGAGLGLTGGAVYLLPGAVAGGAWAARRSATARAVLGFLLLLPGLAAGYYGLMATLSYLGGVTVAGLPASWNPPPHLADALSPLRLLPLALLGAWLLTAKGARE